MNNIETMTEWHDAFMAISKEFEIPKRESLFFIYRYRDYDNQNSDSSIFINEKKKDKDRRNRIMMRMEPLFACQQKLETVCEQSKNHFVRSSFKTYNFDDDNYNDDNDNDNDSSVNELYNKAEDVKYTISLCGYNLTSLHLKGYPFSDLMPIIKTNCPNLKELELKFKEIKDKHFDDVFYNMSHLRILLIDWECDSNIPITLIYSLKKVGETLKFLLLAGYENEKKYTCLPDELGEALSQLTALKKLVLHGFDQNQSLFEKIGEMKNLVNLSLMSNALMKDPNFDKKYDMSPIGNLNNLEYLYIYMDYGVTDEFLINLSNNAKELKTLSIIGTNITDNGMIQINNFRELQDFSLELTRHKKKNKFITDRSVSLLRNEKLKSLDISNCINITNKSIVKLVRYLQKLRTLRIQNTNVNKNVRKVVTKIRAKRYVDDISSTLYVYASFIKSEFSLSNRPEIVSFRKKPDEFY